MSEKKRVGGEERERDRASETKVSGSAIVTVLVVHG